MVPLPFIASIPFLIRFSSVQLKSWVFKGRRIFFWGSSLLKVIRSELRFSVSDDLSGLEEIIGFINGRWVRFEWDPKRERIWYDLSDERHPKQTEALVRIIVRDAAGNNAEWEGNVAFP